MAVVFVEFVATKLSPAYSSVQQGGGCRYCGQERANSAKRLSQNEATQDMVDAGFTPLEPYQGSGRTLALPSRCYFAVALNDKFFSRASARSQRSN